LHASKIVNIFIVKVVIKNEVAPFYLGHRILGAFRVNQLVSQ